VFTLGDGATIVLGGAGWDAAPNDKTAVGFTDAWIRTTSGANGGFPPGDDGAAELEEALERQALLQQQDEGVDLKGTSTPGVDAASGD
jgi:hypothetical protein